MLLTLDGAFVAFLTATVFKRPQDLKPILDRFGTDTWIFMTLMSLALVGSISSALWCLWSRIALLADIGRWFNRIGPSTDQSSPTVVTTVWGHTRGANPALHATDSTQAPGRTVLAICVWIESEGHFGTAQFASARGQRPAEEGGYQRDYLI